MPQPFTLTQAEAERALATGLIRALSPSGTYWTTHRNGRTKTWVTRPGEFRIPVTATDFDQIFVSRANR